jgi:hypothetical protein
MPDEHTQDLWEISRQIRDYGQNPRHIQRLLTVQFDWHQLWAAIDIIEDVDMAIGAYLEGDFPSTPGEQYLRVYGVFQALFVQQDALRHFVEVILPDSPITLVDVLKDVREARNASVGHPSELKRGGDVSAHGINRSTMGKDGFELMSYSEKTGGSHRYVAVGELIAKQRKEAVRILSEVVKQLKVQDEEHKSKFRAESLKGNFHLVLYAFEKISEEIRGTQPVTMGKWAVDELQSALDRFEQTLKKRGLDLGTYDSIEYRYGEIEYPLGELRKFIDGTASEIPSRKAARVYADALQSSFTELMDLAGSIDEEYLAVEQPQDLHTLPQPSS